jgi:hypothetical protein
VRQQGIALPHHGRMKMSSKVYENFILDGQTYETVCRLNGAEDISYAPKLGKVWAKVFREETGLKASAKDFRAAWVSIIIKSCFEFLNV